MLVELFSGAASYSRELVVGSAILLFLVVVFWIRLSGPGVRRDGDMVLTPMQILTRVVVVLYGVVVGFVLYVYLIGEQALREPGKVGMQLKMPDALVTLFVDPGLPVDRNLLFLHGTSAVGAAVFTGLFLNRQLRPGSMFYEVIDRLRVPVRMRGSAGSSHFCTRQEYARFFHPSLGGVTLYGAFWGHKIGSRFNRLDRGQGSFCLSSEDAARGMLVLGAPGAGKSQAVILPAIADRMRQKESMIVVDPQGELKKYVLELASLTGHRVAIHDPTDPASPRFNLAQGIKDISDARAIAEVLIPFNPNPDDRFWSDSASNLLAASLMRFTDLGSIYRALADLKDYAGVLMSRDDGARTLAGSFVASVYNDARLATNIAATLSTALAGWADETVCENTRSSDLSAFLLTDVVRPTVVVLTCPGRTRKVYAPYLGATVRKLMIDLDTLGEKAESGSLLNPVSIIIDEFPQLGRMSSMVADVNLVRKRNLAILLAAQTLTQIHEIYGLQGTQSLLTGMATQIVFGGCDMATAEYYSRTSGLTTERIMKRDPETGQPKEVMQRQRALLTPDEVMSPPRGTATLFSRFVANGYAAQVVVLGQLTRFFERRDWNDLRANLPRRAFELVSKESALERPARPVTAEPLLRVHAREGSATVPVAEAPEARGAAPYTVRRFGLEVEDE